LPLRKVARLPSRPSNLHRLTPELLHPVHHHLFGEEAAHSGGGRLPHLLRLSGSRYEGPHQGGKGLAVVVIDEMARDPVFNGLDIADESHNIGNSIAYMPQRVTIPSQLTAREVLEFYAEWSEKLSDEMYVGPTTATTPDGVRVMMMDVVYNGDPASGEKELAPLRAIGTPIADGVVAQDYTFLQTNNDVAFGHGVRSYAKNGMVKQWSQELVDAMIENDDPRIFIANHVAGGAVGRVGELDTAFPHRNAEIMIVVVAGWMDAAQDDGLIAACRDYYKAIEPYLGGYYGNIDFDHTAAKGNYGPAYERLSKIKGEYDPGNLFRLNSNIEPA
jgi:hypothetical protein